MGINFQHSLKNKKPDFISGFFYPLMQAHFSFLFEITRHKQKEELKNLFYKETSIYNKSKLHLQKKQISIYDLT